MEYVDLATAQKSPGLRLVLLAGAPSPWSQAAKAIVELKRIPAVAVRLRPKDADVRAWTGVPNAPVALYADEPARTGWAEILGLCERLGAELPLVPREREARIRMYGLGHELMSEGGLLWSSRLVMVDASLASGGQAGFVLPVAQHLAARYGHTPGCGPAARARVVEVLDELAAQLASSGGPYLMGAQLTALDLYSATTLNTLVALSETDCPSHPSVRSGFAWMAQHLAGDVPASLLEHRARIYSEHLSLPLVL